MVQLDLNCWYVSLEKIGQAAGADWLPTVPTSDISLDQLERVRIVAAAEDAVMELVRQRAVQSLEQQVIQETISEGSLFTCHRDFYGKGLTDLSYNDPNLVDAPMAEVYSNLKGVPPYRRLRVKYHPSNIYSVSGWSELGGHNRMFLVGYVERLLKTVIHARPLAIGQVMAENGGTSVVSRYGEVYPEEIQEFERIREVPDTPSSSELKALKRCSEQRLKEIIAEMVGVPHPPADWGGERSDLYTHSVTLHGKKLSAAFILKGPGQFRKMTLSILGKNGDQIYRAFSEPAELVVLQHCHDIDSAIVAHLRAFANQAGQQRFYCIMDGSATWRLLKAYGHLN